MGLPGRDGSGSWYKAMLRFLSDFFVSFLPATQTSVLSIATLNDRSSLDTGIIGPQFPPKYRWRYRCRPTPSETTRTFTQLLYRNPSTDLVIILNQIIIIIEDIRFNMAIEVLPITTADIPAAVACIQRAFADDPYFQWIFNPSKVQHLHRISQK